MSYPTSRFMVICQVKKKKSTDGHELQGFSQAAIRTRYSSRATSDAAGSRIIPTGQKIIITPWHTPRHTFRKHVPRREDIASNMHQIELELTENLSFHQQRRRFDSPINPPGTKRATKTSGQEAKRYRGVQNVIIRKSLAASDGTVVDL
jgi:hypothetical protein